MRRVLIVGYPEAQLLDIACVIDVFDCANRLGGTPEYEILVATTDGKPIRCNSGITLSVTHRLDQVRAPLNTVLVVGGVGHQRAARDARLIAQLRRIAAFSERIASVCTGATVLAATGLLNGKRATTHWAYAARLAADYPAITVDPSPLYVRAGNVYTGAGVTSGLDLTLAFVGEDHGPALARDAARALVTYLQRPANQAQVSMFVSAPPPEDVTIREITDYIAANVGADLGAPALARRAGMSTRHLTRLFATHMRTTPGRYVRSVRGAAAAQLLSGTTLPLSAIARRCGFGSTETLRQAFQSGYATAPSTYRRLHQAGRS